MRWAEDPRAKASHRAFLLAWTFFGVYLGAVMAASYLLRIDLLLWGLPQWVTFGNIFLPALFVLLLIVVVERFIPDVPLTDDESDPEGPE